MSAALLGDSGNVRDDFVVLNQKVHNKALVYLDSAASTQKPLQVINAITEFYRRDYANIHRGVHELSKRATVAYEGGRERAARFLNAPASEQCIFTRGTTESINLVAWSYVEPMLQAGDEILISAMEHHSNIVPWQMVCERKGAKLVVVPINDAGELEFDAYLKLLSDKTRLVAITHVSNALGTINPVQAIIEAAHSRNIPVLLDGAQAAPHASVDVQALDVDFYAISSHKIYGPTGVGVLYGRKELLEKMRPYQGGGDMIRSVTFERSTYAAIPARFEAGTPNIVGAVGLGVALDYVSAIGMEQIADYEHELLNYGTQILSSVPGLKIIGTAAQKAAVISFVIEGIHPHDIGTILDTQGIAVRTGHHCAQPVMKRFGIPATTRASLGIYNTKEDLDALVAGLETVLEMLG
ncbi:MAG TPA: cysteine desulfurase [Myxococcales bacterium]|nr:cysteine desulfurase [Myxococcales bacterium]